MNVDDFIQTAIDQGQRGGVAALNPLQRAVYLVSELEVLCDKDGIDSFLDGYGVSELLAAADLLRGAGASTLADGLMEIAESLPQRDDALLTRVTDLVSDRAGYGYDSLARAVAARVAVMGEK